MGCLKGCSKSASMFQIHYEFTHELNEQVSELNQETGAKEMRPERSGLYQRLQRRLSDALVNIGERIRPDFEQDNGEDTHNQEGHFM
jgi:hypothetical protein